MAKQIHYEVTIKEVGRDHILKTSYIGPLSRQGVVDFFGLENDDVEWYRIEIVDEKEI